VYPFGEYMTAEIVIMNREAVVIAADSAVSLMMGQTDRPQKIFTSANKIFDLSPHHAVSIMIFNYASFMGVPWEIIIDRYRKTMKNSPFPTTAEYAEHFIRFLTSEKDIIPPEAEENYFITNAYGYFLFIRALIQQHTNELISVQGAVTGDDILKISGITIQEVYQNLVSAPYITLLTDEDVANLAARFDEKINKIITEVFEQIPIPDPILTQLKLIPPLFFAKSIGMADPLWQNFSGVVITGFGEKDIFPSLISYWIEGRLQNKLRYSEKIHNQITFENGAAIVPFAQHEMVDIFLSGMDPAFEEALLQGLSSIFHAYPDTIIDSIEKLSDEEKTALKTQYTKKSDEIIQHLAEQLKNFRYSNFIPIINVVSSLPKSDLAAMAESLVNITSLKRRVSMQAETVGGPVDVAVISKSDGLVWIKKKQYFSHDLNPYIPSRYSQGGERRAPRKKA
jgi:hypothetical protein